MNHDLSPMSDKPPVSEFPSSSSETAAATMSISSANPMANPMAEGGEGPSMAAAAATPKDGDEQTSASAVGKGELTSASTNHASAASSAMTVQERFGDCALVEIIYLHDCFRGALRTLEADCVELCQALESVTDIDGSTPTVAAMDSGADAADAAMARMRRVAGRFTVIWSVFRAHSAAEDEYIWPALKAKQAEIPLEASPKIPEPEAFPKPPIGVQLEVGEGERRERALSVSTVHRIEQEEYEEDHADEERMFNSINNLISQLRAGLLSWRSRGGDVGGGGAPAPQQPREGGETSGSHGSMTIPVSLVTTARTLSECTSNLTRHLLLHLEKEEQHCMPLVAHYLTKSEINDLVGKIMGKRSSELMSQILTMAVQNLGDIDRDAMVRYMKEAMVGTFFERWLKMGGWMSSSSFDAVASVSSKEVKDGDSSPGGGGGGSGEGEKTSPRVPPEENQKVSAAGVLAPATTCFAPGKSPCPNCEQVCLSSAVNTAEHTGGQGGSTERAEISGDATHSSSSPNTSDPPAAAAGGAIEKYTSATELEKLIRAIMTNRNLGAKQKNLTIQGLRDSVWKSNHRLSKRKREDDTDRYGGTGGAGPVAVFGGAVAGQPPPTTLFATSAAAGAVPDHAAATNFAVAHATMGDPAQMQMSFSTAPASAAAATRTMRETPPSSYFKKTRDGEVKLVWSSDPHATHFHPSDDGCVPLFSASELAPTYHDGGINHVLGCPHYARSCKVRHPSSGRLYTCRLCCEQEREMPMKDKDSPLDRFEVKEVLCMRCNALQPASDKCVNPKCQSKDKPFAKYSCNICNFYDDSPSKAIYHCPFCNVCRTGLGLGIDYRHCMRCNACVSLKDDHKCIPQRLQGNCPICHEDMFESTEPLRGLKCGHVMHLSCFTMYMRGYNYTCPLCKRSADDMGEYFALLDSAIRMQPMPPAYAATTSSIYCQDCGKTGNVAYHFVGLKCNSCGSFNTREVQRGTMANIGLR